MMRVLAILGTVALLLVARGAPAAKIYVSTTGDDANDGLSWATAKATPEAAVDVARATSEADTIRVAEGAYALDANLSLLVPADVALLGGYPRGGGTARDPRAHPSVFERSGSIWPIVRFDRGSGATTIDGFILRRSHGAIRVGDSGPLIRDCILEQNTSGGGTYGSGLEAIYRWRSTPLRVEDCVIRDNAGGLAASGYMYPSAVYIQVAVDAVPMDLGLVMSRTLIEGNIHSSGLGVPAAVMLFTEGGGRLQDVCLRNNPDGQLRIGNLDMTNVLASEGVADYGSPYQCSPSTWRNITTSYIDIRDCRVTRSMADSIAWGTSPAVRGSRQDDLVVTNSIVQGGWPSGTNVIDADPLFVPGPEGDFYLSDVASGQPTTSPGVDAGSITGAEAGLDTYTTRTDSAADAGMVDLGYHPEIVPVFGLNVRRGPVADGLSPYRTVADLPFTDSEGTLTGPWFGLLYYDVPGSAREIIVLADRTSDAVRVEWR